MTPELIKELFTYRLEEARRCGFVVTVEQKNVPPLAMGNTVDVVTVTKVRTDGDYPQS